MIQVWISWTLTLSRYQEGRPWYKLSKISSILQNAVIKNMSRSTTHLH